MEKSEASKFKSYEGALSNVKVFSKSLPGTRTLLIISIIYSLLIGIISSSIAGHSIFLSNLGSVMASGVLVGIVALIVPFTMTIIAFKAMKRYVTLKYILFSSMISLLSYGVFVMLSVSIASLTGIAALGVLVILLGDAAIYAWWFFVSKILLNERKASALTSLIQPTLNLLFLIPVFKILLIPVLPLKILLVKLYFGIFVFLLIAYVIIYFIDSPIKKSLGYSGFDVFTQMLQDWLFNVNIMIPQPIMSNSPSYNVNTDTIVFKDPSGKVKGIFFVPNLHYGPMGTIGSSNFPYLLEKYSVGNYKATTIIMHPTVSDDYNAVSSSEYGKVKSALSQGVKSSIRLNFSDNSEFYEGGYKTAKVTLIKFGSFGIATFTRAPRVTEDIAPETATLFKSALQAYVKHPIMIDAHNARYESAPKKELESVKINSGIANDYIKAISSLHRISKGKLKAGFYSVNPASKINCGVDIAPGNMNISVLSFGKFKYCMIYFNANNVKPQFRESLVNHIRKKYGMYGEVYSTDTHFVNSFKLTASNVLGLHTKYSKELEKMVDQGIESAVEDMSECTIGHSSIKMKNFKIWGANGRDKIVTTLNSMIAIAKLAVPLVIIGGFFLAAWIIYVI
ncbi:CPA3 family transporter [Candidatus Mancarchaeum acidiphilum]|uniref:CPA3 family transporter n=1 Tax=Candidatus Mancarchaeum acidiphilum TaxID=1920749 RepID=A0A218NMM5_9ARCH|nr:DUF2070 family protein [Candidatus Mancarchaeum acidiphilum]ASI13713.1 CPA3 family transporter [Candidatus Mancarchaeum acidiphilum]